MQQHSSVQISPEFIWHGPKVSQMLSTVWCFHLFRKRIFKKQLNSTLVRGPTDEKMSSDNVLNVCMTSMAVWGWSIDNSGPAAKNTVAEVAAHLTDEKCTSLSRAQSSWTSDRRGSTATLRSGLGLVFGRLLIMQLYLSLNRTQSDVNS